jgi:GxxExxY protein
MPQLLEADRVGSIIGAFYAVYNYYGPGLAESVYSGALEEELLDRGHEVVRELLVSVRYRDRHVAWQRLDFVIDDRIIIELKATERLTRFSEKQLISYLRATNFQVGLLLHFGSTAQFHRFVDTKKRHIASIRVGSRHSRSRIVDACSVQPPVPPNPVRTVGSADDANGANDTSRVDNVPPDPAS